MNTGINCYGNWGDPPYKEIDKNFTLFDDEGGFISFLDARENGHEKIFNIIFEIREWIINAKYKDLNQKLREGTLSREEIKKTLGENTVGFFEKAVEKLSITVEGRKINKIMYRDSNTPGEELVLILDNIQGLAKAFLKDYRELLIEGATLRVAPSK